MVIILFRAIIAQKLFIRHSGFPNPNLSRKLARNAAKRAEESRRHRYDRLIDGARFTGLQ